MKKIIQVLIFTIFSLLILPTSINAASTFFEWPAEGSLTSDYGMRDGKMHHGIDIANRSSSVPIRASADGVVRVSHFGYSGNFNNYGNVIVLRHDLGDGVTETLYAHMSSRSVSVGETVQKGEIIGYMGSTGQSTGKHLHFEVHFGSWSKSNSVDPLKVLNGDYDSRFDSDEGDAYKVYHATEGLLDSFSTYAAAKEYSLDWDHTAVIRTSDGKQVFVNGLNQDNYGVFHSLHKHLASFSIKQNAIEYSNNYAHTVVRNSITLQQVYVHPNMGDTRYEVYHITQGVKGEFHFDYLARALMNNTPDTITIEKSTGEQIAQHPDANGLQYEVHHSVHGKLTTFSFLSAAKRYSNDWAHTVVIDSVTKKEMYARDDLGNFKYAVKKTSDDSIIAKFHLESNAEDFAAKYSRGVYIDSL
ncbi:M23 family metallopeptidase [Gracilibacillus sp. D59]|uniref:M23 family metallopeptidase n=1 Tax=Gracilibacillus sp. D59 TaxID=3457434 RepID=UPI003FCED38D